MQEMLEDCGPGSSLKGRVEKGNCTRMLPLSEAETVECASIERLFLFVYHQGLFVIIC